MDEGLGQQIQTRAQTFPLSSPTINSLELPLQVPGQTWLLEMGVGVPFFLISDGAADILTEKEETGLGGEVLAALRGGTCCLSHCLQAKFHFLLLPS